MTSDAEKSFKAKLRAIAKEKNRDPADLWQSLMLERFLGIILANFRFFLRGLYTNVDITLSKKSKSGSKEPQKRLKLGCEILSKVVFRLVSTPSDFSFRRPVLFVLRRL